MALPRKQERKKFGRGEILQDAPPPLASDLFSCLEDVKKAWQKKDNNIAGLWQDWSKLAGEPLASNCRPLNLRRGVLVVGAKHPQWLQALIYNRPQLLARIRAQGYAIKDLRIQQYQPNHPKKALESERSIWAKHPSRIDIHGMSKCSHCSAPAPSGELALWGMCGFCRCKKILSQNHY